VIGMMENHHQQGRWWVKADDAYRGPFGVYKIFAMIRSGEVRVETPVRRVGSQEFRPLHSKCGFTQYEWRVIRRALSVRERRRFRCRVWSFLKRTAYPFIAALILGAFVIAAAFISIRLALLAILFPIAVAFSVPVLLLLFTPLLWLFGEPIFVPWVGWRVFLIAISASLAVIVVGAWPS